MISPAGFPDRYILEGQAKAYFGKEVHYEQENYRSSYRRTCADSALAFGTTVSAADERPMVPPEYSQKGDAWTKNNDQYSSQQIQNMKKAEQKDQKEHAKKVKKHVKKDQKQDNFEQDRNKRYEDQGIHYGQKHEKKAPKVKKEEKQDPPKAMGPDDEEWHRI